MNTITKKTKDYYISVANTSGSGAFRGDSDIETAIVTNGRFYILNGDHSKEYSKYRTLKQCMNYFYSNKPLISSWSDN